MTRINNINYSLPFCNSSIYTKRTCTDNSEVFIASKLNMLYRQALGENKKYESKRNLRKLIEDNHLDETV